MLLAACLRHRAGAARTPADALEPGGAADGPARDPAGGADHGGPASVPQWRCQSRAAEHAGGPAALPERSDRAHAPEIRCSCSPWSGWQRTSATVTSRATPPASTTISGTSSSPPRMWLPLECTCPAVYSPNSYGGADPAFAPFTQFDSSGNAVGGFGPESEMTSRSHSTYHALQSGVSKNSARLGLGLQASYTYSKSIDDTSAVLGGSIAGAGVVLQTMPQNPWNPDAEKGPSTFDATHSFTLSMIQVLPLDHASFLRPLGRTRGLAVPEYHHPDQRPAFHRLLGSAADRSRCSGGHRPDQVEQPSLPTSRAVREDYFGRGTENESFFSIPINVAGGTGPNHGRFGTLGRNTFRGPALHSLTYRSSRTRHSGAAEQRTGHHRISRRVLQRLQPSEFRTAFEYPARQRLRCHQQDRRAFAPDPVFAEIDLLRN